MVRLNDLSTSLQTKYMENLLEIEEKKKTEQSILCPTNPYAASKAAAESMFNLILNLLKCQ